MQMIPSILIGSLCFLIIFSIIMALKTQATSIFRRTQLPSLPNTAYHEQPIEFKPQDINKIIEHMVTKGSKYTQFKKTLSQEEVVALPDRLYKSSFVKVMIRKIIIKMGEQRRLGNSLRGFSKLLLEQIENECWQLILIQRSLLELQGKQSKQLMVLQNLLDKNR